MNPTTFAFDGQAVRVAGDAGTPLFNAADVCAALGLSNPRQAVASHVDADDVHSVDTIDRLGRNQSATFVTESGVYALAFGSRKPEARAFQRWVTAEVLPQIRRTGAYAAAPAVPQTLAKALRLAADQAEQLERQQAVIAEQAVSVAALDRIAGTDGTMPPTSAAKVLRIAPRELIRWMDSHGWTFVQGGERRAYAERIKSGDLTQVLHEIGDGRSRVQVYVTAAGVAKLAKRLPKGGQMALGVDP